jgi:hypothetical protein
MTLLTIRDSQMAALTAAFEFTWLCSEIQTLYPPSAVRWASPACVDSSRRAGRARGGSV